MSTEPRAITAILVGATGLVGSAILKLLLGDPRFGKVVVLARRTSGAASPKVEEHLINFEAPSQWSGLVRGDVLYSALGTTLKAAGSKEAQRRVDHGYQLEVATAAKQNGVPCYVLVSSAGATPRATVFYSRMKGELERDVEALAFARSRILRPGLLDGERVEARAAERIALGLLRPIAAVLPPSARPVRVEVVARAAIGAAFDLAPGLLRYEAADIFRRGA